MWLLYLPQPIPVSLPIPNPFTFGSYRPMDACETLDSLGTCRETCYEISFLRGWANIWRLASESSQARVMKWHILGRILVIRDLWTLGERLDGWFVFFYTHSPQEEKPVYLLLMVLPLFRILQQLNLSVSWAYIEATAHLNGSSDQREVCKNEKRIHIAKYRSLEGRMII